MSIRILHVLPHRGGGAETYIDLLEEMSDFHHERIPLSRSRTPLAAVPSIARGYPHIARLARAADVTHAHGDVAAMLAVPFMVRRRAVWSTHGLHLLRRVRGPRAQVVRAGVRTVIATSACTICTSEAEREELLGVAGPRLEARLRLVRNGIELPVPPDASARDNARHSLGLSKADVVALFVGQLEPRKGILDVLAAVRQARDQDSPIVLLVVGDGPLAPVLSAASDGVRPLGHRTDLPHLYAAADIFVMPSEREGLSLALLEAMGHALATVATDAPGNAEAVDDAGLLVPVGDARALAEALMKLVTDPAERGRLGAAARARVEAEFTARGFRAAISDIYRTLLEDPSAVRAPGQDGSGASA